MSVSVVTAAVAAFEAICELAAEDEDATAPQIELGCLRHTNKRIQMHLGSVLFLDLLDLYLLDLYLTGPAICLDLPGSAWICSI